MVMESADTALAGLCENIRERNQRTPVTFKKFLSLSSEKPELVFRDVFQMFYDMVYRYVGEGIDEYPDDPESINYVYYDCSNLFAEGVDHPFFADRLFANRLIHHIASFKRGFQQNRIYIFEGPHGCGKSTFLNNLLMKFEHYTKTEEGASYETLWRLDQKELGALTDHETYAFMAQLRSLVHDSAVIPKGVSRERLSSVPKKDYLEVPCPSHDSPLLLIPKAYRRELLDRLIMDSEFKERLFSEKHYEWVFRDNPCAICMSLYETLLDLLDSPSKVFDMIYARRYQFNRRLGEGISVFNPGDKMARSNVITNELLQNQLNGLLKDSNRVRYIFSRYAKTNNGIYALMDVKDNNKERFTNLHGIISEGVHKVEDIEEDVNSLFLALMNPEDRENIADTQSFSDRIIYIKIAYVLDYNTEVRIYKNVFGDRIETSFLPRVLQNFAKVIISSRLKAHSEGLAEWIGDPAKYGPYCDQNLQLLKMDIFAGLIPSWLTEEDRKGFTARRRRAIIAESESEGDKGFSGRDSIKIFNEFYSTYAKKDKLINMAMVCNFFRKSRTELAGSVPEGFLDSLVRFYNYTVLQEVKESLYFYNEERISKDIQNYLFAVNFETGIVMRCVFTGEELSITEDFLDGIERRFLGSNPDDAQRRSFRKDIQNHYASKTLTQEMLMEGRGVCETEVYRLLYGRYVHNLKEKVMDPFLKNDNFRNAIKDYATESFKAYDKRVRDEVNFLMQNLKKKHGYTRQGAKEVCIYVIDNDLAKMFSAV
jgi:predicted Ser/Thr protein kinase